MQPKRSKIENLKNLVEGIKKIPIKSRTKDDQSYSGLNESSFDINPHEASNVHSEMNDHYNKLLDASAFETKTINDRVYNDYAEDEMLNNLDEPEILKNAFAKDMGVEENTAGVSVQNNVDNTEHQFDSEGKRSLDEGKEDLEEDRPATHSQMNGHQPEVLDDGERSLDKPKPRLGGKKIPIALPPPGRSKVAPRVKPKFAPPKAPAFSDFSLKQNIDVHHEEGRPSLGVEALELNKNTEMILEGKKWAEEPIVEVEDQRDEQPKFEPEIVNEVVDKEENDSVDQLNNEEKLDGDVEVDKADPDTDHPKEVVSRPEPEIHVEPIRISESTEPAHPQSFSNLNMTETTNKKIPTPRFETKATPRQTLIREKGVAFSEFLDFKNNMITLQKTLKETKHELDKYKRIVEKYVHQDQQEEPKVDQDLEDEVSALKEENDRLKEALAEARSERKEQNQAHSKLNKSEQDYEELIEGLKQYYGRLFHENNVLISEREGQIQALVNQNKQLIHQHRMDESNMNEFEDFCSVVQEQFDQLNQADDNRMARLLEEVKELEVPVLGGQESNEEVKQPALVVLRGAEDDVMRKAFEFIEANTKVYVAPFIPPQIQPIAVEEVEDEGWDDQQLSSVDTVVDDKEQREEEEAPVVLYEKESEGLAVRSSEDPESEHIDAPSEPETETQELIIENTREDLSVKTADNRVVEEPVVVQPEIQLPPQHVPQTTEGNSEFIVQPSEKIEDPVLLDQVSTLDVKDLHVDAKEEVIVKEFKVEPPPLRKLQKRKLKVTQMTADERLFDNEEDTGDKQLSNKSGIDTPSITFSEQNRGVEPAKREVQEQPDKKLTNIFTQPRVARPPKPFV